jgi:hypothetical protein
MIAAFLRWVLSSALGGNAVAERALRAVEGPILFEDFFEAIDVLLVPSFHKSDNWPALTLERPLPWLRLRRILC